MPKVTVYKAYTTYSVYVGVGSRILLSGFQTISDTVPTFSVEELIVLADWYDQKGFVQLFDLDVVVKPGPARFFDGEPTVYVKGKPTHKVSNGHICYIEVPQEIADYVNTYCAIKQVKT